MAIDGSRTGDAKSVFELGKELFDGWGKE